MVLLGGLLAAALVRVRRRYLLIVVDGISMAPTVHPGQRLVVRRGGLATIRRGSLVVVVLGELMVKRAVALPGDPVPPGIPVNDPVVPDGRLVVLGDNAAHSFDSRRAGYINATDVVGVVIGRNGSR
jgi:signal peptidase I